jgi:hypothetical protein
LCSPYVKKLLGITEEQSRKLKEEIKRLYKANLPGAVRVSLGFYNNQDEINRLIETLQRISRKEHKGRYKLNPASGEYFPEGFSYNYQNYFDF